MNLSQVKQYTEGLLKKWFTNKKVLDKFSENDGKVLYNGSEISGTSDVQVSTKSGNQIQNITGTPNNGLYVGKPSNSEVLDKFTEDTDGNLLYDAEKVSNIAAVNCKSKSLLDNPITILAKQSSNSVFGLSLGNSLPTYTLNDNIEGYDYLTISVLVGVGAESYYQTFRLRTDVGSENQWFSCVYGGGSDSAGEVGARLCMTVQVWGKSLVVGFVNTYSNQVIIKEVKGYKYIQPDTAGIIAHSHDNQAVLDLITEPSTGILAFRGTPLNTSSYIETLYNKTDITFNKTSSLTGTHTFSLLKNVWNYDEVKITFDIDGYYTTETVRLLDGVKGPYWISKNYGARYVGLIFEFPTNGMSIIITGGNSDWNKTTVRLIEGVVYKK